MSETLTTKDQTRNETDDPRFPRSFSITEDMAYGYFHIRLKRGAWWPNTSSLNAQLRREIERRINGFLQLEDAAQMALARLDRLDDAGTGSHSPAYNKLKKTLQKVSRED